MGNTEKFESIASSYETANTITLAKASEDAIREYLVDIKNKDAIDFGCGTGLVGMSLVNDFKSMVFLDTSQNMLDQVKRKIADFNVCNADTLCVDFEKEIQTNLHADYVIMALVLLHIRDFESVLAKIYDILNPDGHLLIVDFDKNENVNSDLVHNGFDQKQLADIMRKIGFRLIQTKTFYSGQNLFMGQDATMFILDSHK